MEIGSTEIYGVVATLYVLLIIRNVAEVKKNTCLTRVSIFTVIGVALSIPAIPILITIFLIVYLYRLFISLLLRIQYGKNFSGILNGSDSFHIVGDTTNGITNSCVMVRCEKYSSKEFFGVCKTIYSRCFAYSKFNSEFIRYYGYAFMLKKPLHVDDCIVEMKTVQTKGQKMDKEELHELLSYHYNQHLPEGGKIPWQVLVGTQSVNWRDDGYDYYPMIFKMHHAIGDGITLIKVLTGLLSDRQTSTDRPPILKHLKNKLSHKSKLQVIKETFEYFAILCYIFYLLPSSIVIFFGHKGKDANILCSNSMSNRKVLASSTENTQFYVEKIKKIKQKLPKISFSSILIAAFSAGLENYFKKKNSSLPKAITASLPVVTGSSDLRYLVPGHFDVKDITITNTYSILMMNLPIDISKSDEFPDDKPHLKRLKLVGKQSDLLKNSTDYIVNYLVIKLVFAILPLPILETILKNVKCTTTISILAGPPRISCDNGLLVVSDLIPYVPHLHNIGTTFGAITYDDRLQIAFNADDSIISSQKDAQRIVDDVHTYLDGLEKEILEDS